MNSLNLETRTKRHRLDNQLRIKFGWTIGNNFQYTIGFIETTTTNIHNKLNDNNRVFVVFFRKTKNFICEFHYMR